MKHFKLGRGALNNGSTSLLSSRKDYHKTLDSSSFHLSAHNVYYVKCNLMVSQFMALSIWRSLACLPFPNPPHLKRVSFLSVLVPETWREFLFHELIHAVLATNCLPAIFTESFNETNFSVKSLLLFVPAHQCAEQPVCLLATAAVKLQSDPSNKNSFDIYSISDAMSAVTN